MGAKSKKQLRAERIGKAVSKMTDSNIQKLREVFAIDGTIEEACFYAGIVPQTYYNWIKNKPELLEEFKALRNRPVLLARQTVIKEIPKSYANAIDYLKRKRKLEFGDSQDLTSAGDKIVFMPPELLKKYGLTNDNPNTSSEPNS